MLLITAASVFLMLATVEGITVKPVRGRECGPDFEEFRFNLTEQEEILDFLNIVRDTAAAGRERDFPRASNMRLLKWDEELALVAQHHANHCVATEHNEDEIRRLLNETKYPTVGKNIVNSTLPTKSEEPMKIFLKEIDEEWYKREVELFNKSLIESYVYDRTYSNYSQMIWAETDHVGCGASIFKNEDGLYNYLMVCNFGPGGNITGEPVYREGTPCSECRGICDFKYTSLCRTP